MVSRTLLIIPAMLLFGFAQESRADESAPLPDYRLVWSDEFNTDGPPDPTKWTFEHGFVRNGERQWYQPQNAFVSGGHLVIEARREHRAFTPEDRQWNKGSLRGRKAIDFTSSSLLTKGRFNWRYGRIEIRAKLAAKAGLWPALWFVGTAGKWPAGGEIDLLEYYDASILGNFAWAGADQHKPVWRSRKIKLADWTRDPQWDQKFHVWTMDWDARQITLMLDGRTVNHLDLDQVNIPGGTDRSNPFRKPFYLIMNLALGGQKGGPLKNTPFPSRFEVDYVRVYQRAPK